MDTEVASTPLAFVHNATANTGYVHLFWTVLLPVDKHPGVQRPDRMAVPLARRAFEAAHELQTAHSTVHVAAATELCTLMG